MKEIPDFIQKRIDEFNQYRHGEREEPKIEMKDIWSMDPERLFPDSPTLQQYFIEVRDKKNKNVFIDKIGKICYIRQGLI